LSAQEFELMHYGLTEFAFGWEWYTDEISKLKYSYHVGNPGTFLTKVYVCKQTNKAFIIFANIQSDEANKGIEIILDKIFSIYGN